MTKAERNPKPETRTSGLDRAISLGVGFGLAQAGYALPFFPLAALLEHFQPLKPLEHISFATQGGRRAQTSML
jgi:hypothetical protein